MCARLYICNAFQRLPSLCRAVLLLLNIIIYACVQFFCTAHSSQSMCVRRIEFVFWLNPNRESLSLLYSTPVAVWVSFFVLFIFHLLFAVCFAFSIAFLFSTVLRMIEQHADSVGFVFVYCARARAPMREEPPN